MIHSPSRSEHLRWCKDRALAYVASGELDNAFASFSSDVLKHPLTASHGRLIEQLGMPMLLGGQLSTPEQMRRWIEGFR